MIQRIRRHVNATTVIAVFALVFAMSGGAYAAKKFLITSKGQISPKVLKSLKGATGAAGATGAKGANGVAGPAGPAGAPGPQGPAGAKGENGTNGKDGIEGKKGEQGIPGTTGFTNTLPSGRTETGTWSAIQENENIGALVPISFSIPLPEGLDATHVHAEGEANFEEACPGSAEAPKAAAGNFCIYVGLEQELAVASIRTPFSFAESGTGTSGAILVLSSLTPETSRAAGSWAVTAP